MSSHDDLTFLSAAEQGGLIMRRAISPLDLVRNCLDRIERYDPLLRAYITVCGERALAAARRAESEISAGQYRGPLHGIPFGVKDQLFSKGVKTTLGSRVMADFVPDYDATVITRLEHAGAILIGKENLDELGKGGTNVFPYGQPRNPWHIAHTPFGSSSGSGIAPAAGFTSGSLGEDTGGSVRCPAAFNGVVGLRPTFGRVSRFGAAMYGWTADTIGPLTRTVQDNAIFLQAIAGHDPRDPLTSTRPVPGYSAALNSDLRGITLGVVREMTWTDGADRELLAAMERALEVLRGLGAVVREVSLKLARYSVPLQLLTSDSDIASMMLRKWLRTHWDDLDVNTRTRLAAGCLIPASVYHRAMRARVLVRREILGVLAGCDALVCPTDLHPPGRIDSTHDRAQTPRDMEKALLRRISTYPFSMANIPAIALPMGYTTSGLPLSLQIGARPFDESGVYHVAYAFERATPWHSRHPDLERCVRQTRELRPELRA
jgi:aspartyl-tRNA(Asn)/glutamyl-tRNA(Gln) amidotransferase subunit A